MTRSLLFTALVSLAGCGGASDFPQTHPVSGTVAKAGRPMDGGVISATAPFLGEKNLIVVGTIDASGNFSLTTKSTASTRTAPGAPVGEYNLIVSPPGTDQSVTPVTLPGPFVVEAKTNQWALSLKK